MHLTQSRETLQRSPARGAGPIGLSTNRPRHLYRGGSAITAFRGVPEHDDDHRPEDWLASTTALDGRGAHGLTVLPDGRLLRDAVVEDPAWWLGPEHVAAFGGDTELLVKLLAPGERLPVHCHPGRGFARRWLGSAHGKTEAWLVLETDGPDAAVRLGFREEVDAETLAGWVTRQDRRALLDALNVVPVAPGDTVFVPAGVPHTLGAGVLVVELQEPSDLSMLLEHAGLDLGQGASPFLGLPAEVALECVDRTAWTPARLARVHLRRPGGPSLLPPAAEPWFRAERWRVRGGVELDPGYAVLVVVAGRGVLRTEDGEETPLVRGSAVLVPFACGPVSLEGELEAIRCRPPEPAGPVAAA